MDRMMLPEHQAQARQLAADLHAQAEDVFQDIAELLSSTPDEQLFGDTEFVVRQHVLKLVAGAFTARLAQKKTETSVPVSIVPTANDPLPSTATGNATL